MHSFLSKRNYNYFFLFIASSLNYDSSTVTKEMIKERIFKCMAKKKLFFFHKTERRNKRSEKQKCERIELFYLRIKNQNVL